MRKSHSYCNHNKVVKSYADGGAVTKKKAKKKKKAADVPLGSGMAQNAANELQNRRKQQMQDLGLKDGGAVKMKPPKKGKKPKKIGEGMGPPGGPMTPGARGTYPPKRK